MEARHDEEVMAREKRREEETQGGREGWMEGLVASRSMADSQTRVKGCKKKKETKTNLKT